MDREKNSSDIDKLDEVKHSIEITPEMAEAGYWHVFEFDRETESIQGLVEKVYRSMEKSRLDDLCEI